MLLETAESTGRTCTGQVCKRIRVNGPELRLGNRIAVLAAFFALSGTAPGTRARVCQYEVNFPFIQPHP